MTFLKNFLCRHVPLVYRVISIFVGPQKKFSRQGGSPFSLLSLPFLCILIPFFFFFFLIDSRRTPSDTMLEDPERVHRMCGRGSLTPSPSFHLPPPALHG